jgi:PIN domain nuclease of toxin-antitoxin system
MSAVLDTCAVLAWTTGHDLPADLRPPFLVCAVTWCEIAWKHRAGRLPLPLPRDTWIAEAQRLVETVPVDTALFLAAVDLEWEHRDPADRLIVALARRRALPLITCDQVIAGFQPGCRW